MFSGFRRRPEKKEDDIKGKDTREAMSGIYLRFEGQDRRAHGIRFLQKFMYPILEWSVGNRHTLL